MITARGLLCCAWVAAIFVVAACLGGRSDTNTQSSADGEKGWCTLFNGTDLAGWKVFVPGRAQDDAADTSPFSASGGVLTCEGTPGGYIETKELYTNFELRLQWRFDPSKGAGNSGVLLRVVGPDMVWPKSIEAQLHSENAGDIWNIGEVPMKADPARTSGRRTTKASSCSEFPLGQWNSYRIVLDEGHLQLFVNDVLQNEASGCEVVPGRIGLQSEGSYIQFRDIRIKPITHAPGPAGTGKESTPALSPATSK
ncbi:MAG: DUF1080 domain-containing protein [Phycisphaerales bacterium]|nr:DUF1080 domain-containing protein [Phycisphaerales bacterium]